MQNLAVIDLGSNTFHLLIAKRLSNGHFKEVYRRRVYARLARSGIGKISEPAFREGLKTIQEFIEEIDARQVQHVKLVGTEMLRIAPNGPDFVRAVKERVNMDIEIISGLKEAEYIYLGVKQLLPKSSYLIMDIGGGSVEFILVKDGRQKWAASFPIGIAVLYFQFHTNNPIGKKELEALTEFLAKKTTHLAEAMEEESIEELVGSSGVFETFFDVLDVPPDELIDAEKVRRKLQKLIHTSYEERMEIQTIPKTRKKMIIVASVLLNFVLNLTSVKRIRYSPNSLKEGLLYSMIQENET